VSDNIPFNAQEFKDFAKQYKFKMTFISPGHSQANGKVESTVKIAKRLIKKAKKSGNDLNLALLQIRNTPTEGMNSTPAQRLFQRRTRTLLPMKHSQLKPQVQKDVYNRSAKDLRSLKPGETVRVQSIRPHKKEWQKGIVQKTSGIRSYDVELEDGTKLRRNRKFLRPTPESFVEQAVEADAATSKVPSRKHHADKSKATSHVSGSHTERIPSCKHADKSNVASHISGPHTEPRNTSSTTSTVTSSTTNRHGHSSGNIGHGNHGNVNNHGDSSAVNPGNTQATTTRSGRHVKPSSRLKDFVVFK
jgi:hypothetical protein